MQTNPKHLNAVHKASASSKQSPTARFFRELGKLAIEHPGLTVSLIVTAATLSFGSGKTQAQTKENKGKPVAGLVHNKDQLAMVSDKEKTDVEKNFTVELKDGRMYISNFQTDDGKNASFDFSIADKKYGFLKDSDIKNRIFSQIDDLKGVYLIADMGIIFVAPKLSETTTIEAIQKDASIVMIYTLLPDGRLVGTTQTTFLLINSRGAKVLDYKDIIGAKLNLQNPTITVSKENNHIVIRDQTLITEDGPQFMIDLNIFEFRYKIVPMNH